MMRYSRAVLLLVLLTCSRTADAVSADPFIPHVWALEMAVPDTRAASRVYVEGLGFSVEREAPSGAWVILVLDQARVVLRRAGEPAAPAGTPRVYLNLRVGDLTSAAERARKAGFRIPDPTPRANAIGRGVQITDPGGNPLNLIDIDGDEMRPQAAPGVFNVGLRVPDMAEAERFFTALGFETFTRDYLPRTLVFKRHGAMPLVLHATSGSQAAAGDAGRLVFRVADVDVAEAQLTGLGWQPERRERGHWSGRPALRIPAPAGLVEMAQTGAR